MKVMDAREIEKRFGITDEQLDAWEKDASEGILHGAPLLAAVCSARTSATQATA